MRRIALAVSIAFIVTGSVTSAAQAEPQSDLAFEISPGVSVAVDDARVESELADRRIELDALAVAGDEVALESTSELGSGADVDSTLTVDFKDSAADFSILTEQGVSTTYAIDIVDLNDDRVELIFTDTATGQTSPYASDQGSLAAVPLILGIPLTVSVLESLLAAALDVVFATVAYAAVTEAINAINARGSQYQHFMAMRQSASLFIGNRLSLNGVIRLFAVGGVVRR
ncbi:hypothetical protein [Cellulomonas fimi]|uniref:Uncharacterized protein n=1 Tax=Cellulomonas fimi TaxID=1708 RepID=A0A7Y0LY13_CELFI|nr:hypothetical protein [Cellulomonas fimi]NMR20075.1 hypothetical protein [Cellulomonas fimi]